MKWCSRKPGWGQRWWDTGGRWWKRTGGTVFGCSCSPSCPARRLGPFASVHDEQSSRMGWKVSSTSQRWLVWFALGWQHEPWSSKIHGDLAGKTDHSKEFRVWISWSREPQVSPNSEILQFYILIVSWRKYYVIYEKQTHTKQANKQTISLHSPYGRTWLNYLKIGVWSKPGVYISIYLKKWWKEKR